ncbi:MAG: lytic transglycosylase domain-containing protein [bacterium]|nr:lytic transglycosylase domain-containing protein [bacterium]
MIRARRHLAILSILASLPIVLLGGPAKGPKPALVAVPPPNFEEVQSFFQTRLTRLPDSEIVRLTATILREAQRHELDPTLILGLIQVESSGNPAAVSKVGALGLMQLRPSTASAVAQDLGIAWQGADSLFEPNLNVSLGVHYLAELIDRFGEIDTALAAYNWGPTRIARAIRRGRNVPVRYTQSVHRAHSALI